MLEYTRKFIDTCFDFENSHKLMAAFGGALYHDESVMGKIFVLSGAPGSGKSSIIQPFFSFMSHDYEVKDPYIIVIDGADINKIEDRYGFDKNKKQVIFVTTCSKEIEGTDGIEIIRTSGNRMPLEDYKKFCREMEFFKDDFFRKCMIEFALRKKYNDIIMVEI